MGVPQFDADVAQWMVRTTEVIAGRSAVWEATNGWSAAHGSHAEWELDRAEQLKWGNENPVVLVHNVVLEWWDAADGYLGAVESLFRDKNVTHAVPYTVRGAIEPCHKISWLLEARHGRTEKPVTLQERAARAHLEELFSRKHQRDTVRKLAGKSDEAFIACDREYADFRDRLIPSLFTDIEGLDGEPGDWRVAGQRWRGPTWLAEWYAKNKMDGPAILGNYDALSGMSHPTLWGQREFVEYVPVDGGGLVRRRSVSQDFLERVVGAGLSTYWRACADLASYFGWDRAPLDQWADEINAWRPELIGSD